MVSKDRNYSQAESPIGAVPRSHESLACGYCGSRNVLQLVAGLQLLKIGEQLVSATDSKRALLPVLVELCEECHKIQLKESS
jgi:hypothetical protein